MADVLQEQSQALATGGVAGSPLAKCGLPLCLLLTLVPWVIVIGCTAGLAGAANFVGYAAMVIAAGYVFVWLALPSSVRGDVFLLSPALGIVAFSAITALWVRLRLPLMGSAVLWLILSSLGVILLWRDRKRWTKKTVQWGWIVVLFSVPICCIFFLPSARHDAVFEKDGSFNWIYSDTQHFYALAESVERDDRPPLGPGTYTTELLYHFGPYAPAAVIARGDGLPLGDALARVTRGASIWALILSCFVAGTLLSLRATGETFGGIASVAGLFFYGALLTFFGRGPNTSSYVQKGVLFTIPGVAVLADGGPFSHLILGHSLLHGLGAITVVMGLCLALRGTEKLFTWRAAFLLTLPAFVVPVNSVASMYCVGVVGILLLWGRLRSAWPWLGMAAMVGAFLISWKIMGYSHAPDRAGLVFNPHITWEWWTVTNTFIVGLGVRLLAFRWVSKDRSDPVSVLFLVGLVGLLSLWLIPQLPSGNEHYGIYFLQSMFSIFAFSRLPFGFWKSKQRLIMATDWIRFARNGLSVLVIIGILTGMIDYLRHFHSGIQHFQIKLILAGVLLAALISILHRMRRNARFAQAAATALMVVLCAGFLAWITPWLNYGHNRLLLDIRITPGEVQGLRRLRSVAGYDDHFATNKHDHSGAFMPYPFSYAYGPLSERQPLLEGYMARGEMSLPWFPEMLHDNDLMFTTSNSEQLHKLARTWDVQWLVARPGTDIALPRPLPKWLVEQKDSGTLKIYHITQ